MEEQATGHEYLEISESHDEETIERLFSLKEQFRNDPESIESWS
jgi:hypothetical protein